MTLSDESAVGPPPATRDHAAPPDAGTAAFSPLDFRRVLSAWPTGIAVVTAQHAGEPAGLVCNSFTSVSLSPPLVSWCVGKESSRLGVWLRARAFAVHFLPAGRSDLVTRFSRKDGDKFAGLDWVAGTTGAPLLPGCAAHLECRTWQQYDGGDHVILVGQVVGMAESGGPVLSFHRGRVGRMP